ncbi:cysteine desulfurase, partial [Candidatus Binatia bacterium]|nr:cysteine desulfurase [Candidatus Binatia bacterium]
MNLDHNAGGRVRREVIDAVTTWLRADHANPSSVHAAGRRAREAVEAARDAVAALVGARASEVVFTSGGTEANNLAIRGIAQPGTHVVSTSIEHASILRPLDAARAAGCTVTLVAPAPDGTIAAHQVSEALRDETRLVSIGWANGEIGTVQPLAEIAATIRAHGDASTAAPRVDGDVAPATRRGQPRRVLLHSDAVQAAGACAVDLRQVDVDLLTLSGHKLGALPGVGALVIRDAAAIVPQILGGPHERQRRAGTENVPGIVGFGVAARLARAERDGRDAHLRQVRAALLGALAQHASPLVVHGMRDGGLAGTLSVAFPGVRADALVIALDLQGIAAATGPACAAGAAEPSHVLRAIGCDDETARATLRLSFGTDLTLADAERAAHVIARC